MSLERAGAVTVRKDGGVVTSKCGACDNGHKQQCRQMSLGQAKIVLIKVRQRQGGLKENFRDKNANFTCKTM